MIDSNFLKHKLAEAEYDPALGVRVVHLAKTTIGVVAVEHVVVQMDPGKGLRPHVHEQDGEIGIPMTKGFVRFGTPLNDKNGEYILENDKVQVKWEEEIALEVGKSFEVPAGKAHVFYAGESEGFVVFFVLPTNHLGKDRKWVTKPEM